MGGASREQNLISVNTTAGLHQALAATACEVYSADMRVKVSATGLYTYPDVVVTCEQPRFEDDKLDTLVNPQLIVEVLSESTEQYDRGKKFEQYRHIDSLREYVLVAQDRPYVERYLKNAEGQWVLSDATGLDAMIVLSSVGCALALREVYAKVLLTE